MKFKNFMEQKISISNSEKYVYKQFILYFKSLYHKILYTNKWL
jgi:hypothetical protein